MAMFERVGNHIFFNGRKYYKCRDYWTPTGYKTKVRGSRKDLHIAVYEKFHGPVPKGFLVHHIDHNPDNNHPSNLQCMSRSEHQRHHVLDKFKKNMRRRRCAHCKKFYMSGASFSKYCGAVCNTARRRKDGTDNEMRPCRLCNKPFSINKYIPTQTCSKPCFRGLLRQMMLAKNRKSTDN